MTADSWDVSPLVTFCPKTPSLGTFGPAAIPTHPEDLDHRNPKTHAWDDTLGGLNNAASWQVSPSLPSVPSDTFVLVAARTT